MGLGSTLDNHVVRARRVGVPTRDTGAPALVPRVRVCGVCGLGRGFFRALAAGRPCAGERTVRAAAGGTPGTPRNTRFEPTPPRSGHTHPP
jgi:hypothetical protein